MAFPRDLSLTINSFLDTFLPPLLRDSRWLMSFPMRLLFKQHTSTVMDFKDQAFSLSPARFAAIYRQTAPVMQLQGATDLNSRCQAAIQSSIVGSTVLEVGCGRGFLTGLLSSTYSVSACDIVLFPGIKSTYPKVSFKTASLARLPYPSASFDTVICTHTLEHVQDLSTAISELRRVTRRRLIIVVPKQRPYRYTFNLHLHFFPYPWSLYAHFGHHPSSRLTDLGDWFYLEDTPPHR